ncbi:COG1361 S-layer family protein [Methanoregula sp.]|uniref:COG1361 S-layer family protein n=1 Tax=Methanoregula sp. TaxID=2052170 RepID=UPI0035638581
MFGITQLRKDPGIRDLTTHNRLSHLGSGKQISPRRSAFGAFLLLIVAIGFLVLPAGAYTTPDSLVAAGKVYVSSYTIDPAVLFSGDTATATFSVTNGNSNSGNTTTQGIVVNHATFGDNNIRLVSGTYDTSSNVGPLQIRTYVFSVATDESDGTYYPTFSLDLRDADSLFYRTPVKVDNTPLMMSVISKPDTFTQGKKESVTVQIANPRQNDVKNVILEVTGNGTTITPSTQYLGALSANSATNVTFSVTPDTESVPTMTVKYDNGDNHHSITQSLPITFGTDKKQAAPEISNIVVKLNDGVYHVTGDVTNAGLTTANGVTVNALSPAVPQDPYKTYVIGALKPDDFGSFEVTFAASGETSIPLQASYKDSDGNLLSSGQMVSLSQATETDSKNQQGGTSFVIPGIIILIVLGAGGWYVYTKKIRKQ